MAAGSETPLSLPIDGDRWFLEGERKLSVGGGRTPMQLAGRVMSRREDG